jgi:hypothetical protein
VTTEPDLSGAPGLAARALALVVTCGLAWAALSAPDLPRPASASAPARQFSASRALVHVNALAGTPRPVASTMNAQAREYILHTLRGMGLEPEVQQATVHTQTMDDGHNVHVTLAVVHNIIVRKHGIARGHASRPALLVASHYDSSPDSLGAADVAPAAAMLETLRALQAGQPPEDDVVFLFADGDKIRALGEQAFVQQHPLAGGIGTVLKFSNLGNHGPLYLYNAHGPSGAAIGRWASAAPLPHGSSFMRALHRLSGPGIGPLAALDAPVLQMATVQGWPGIDDSPARLDPASLEHEGDTMLALVREFSGRYVASVATTPDVAWFPLPWLGMVSYPAWFAWPVAVLACVVLAGACWNAIRRGHVEPSGLAKGAFGFALIAAAPVAVLFLAGQQATIFELVVEPASRLPNAKYLAAGAALLGAVHMLLQRWLRKQCGACASALGALVTAAVLMLALTLAVPGASYLLAWPVLAGAAAFGLAQSRRISTLRRPWRAALLVAGLAPALALILSTLRYALCIPSPPRVLLGVFLLALLLGLASPVLAQIGRRFVARVFAVSGLALLALPGTAGAPADASPRPVPLVYYKDMPTWSEWWLARAPVLDDWSARLFAGQPKPHRLVDVFGWDSDDVWYHRAPRSAEVQFPYAIQLVNDPSPGRRIEFDLTSKNRAPHIELSLQGGKPWRASVNGIEITNDDQIRNWSLSVYGMEDKELHFVLDLVGDPYLGVRVEEHMPGVPQRALERALPVGAFIPGTGQTVTADTLWFR